MVTTAPSRPAKTRQSPLVARVATPRVPEAVERPAGSALAEAVLAVQAAAPKLIRDATGQAGPRTYGYVTLDAIVDAVLPLLVEHELLWRTFPTTGPAGEPALRYRMTHIPSGEFEEDVMSLCVAKPGAQEQGSGITYAKRYSLVAYLNLTVDPDDDGAAASMQNRASSAANGNAPQPTAAAPKPSDRPASANQRKMLRAKARAAELDAPAFANVLKASWGDEPADLDPDAAERFIDRALDRLPARLVDAVIAGIEQTGASS